METWNELTVKVKTEDTARASDVCTVIAPKGGNYQVKVLEILG